MCLVGTSIFKGLLCIYTLLDLLHVKSDNVVKKTTTHNSTLPERCNLLQDEPS